MIVSMAVEGLGTSQLCRLYNVPIVSVCSSQHGLKQIKPCFNARTGGRQHCAQMEGFDFSHINLIPIPALSRVSASYM